MMAARTAAQAPVTPGVVVLDSERRIVAIEPALLDARGLRVADVLGREVREFGWLDALRVVHVCVAHEDLLVARLDARPSSSTASVGLRDAFHAATECVGILSREEPAGRGSSARDRLAGIAGKLRTLAMAAASDDLAMQATGVEPRAVVDEALVATARQRPIGTSVVIEGRARAVSEDDALLLEQVLSNVLTNAGEALSERARVEPFAPEIVVRLGSDKLLSFAEIADNGFGASPSVLAEAFEAGFTTKSTSTHLGMGLSVARRIMSLLNGSILLAPARHGGAVVDLEWRCPTVDHDEVSR
jgi:signal transduction histidine kinase